MPRLLSSLRPLRGTTLPFPSRYATGNLALTSALCHPIASQRQQQQQQQQQQQSQPHPSAFRTFTFNHSTDFNKLAHSRSAGFLSQKNELPYIEYSSNAELIRSSEVDPFAPAPGATKEAVRRALEKESIRQQQEAAAAAAAAVAGTGGVKSVVDHPQVQAEMIRELTARVEEMQARLRRGRFLGAVAVVWAAAVSVYLGGGEDLQRYLNGTSPGKTLREQGPVEVAGQRIEPPIKNEALLVLEPPEKDTIRAHKPFYKSLFWSSASPAK
ncbi:hypothetical protein BD289DRAFT_481954 [Coniella lustricola]|uniref:Uncharacterized protein n=1 Tax=Coniella lustricola TaxID=2025994 RepID=A0A2T3AAD5_9PEZI|nr:hypothetical protein BD289DRAFT_481954 [Coniella lustricola]